jgi:hypothetical protein
MWGQKACRGLTTADMRRCHWVKPVMVCQVKFTEWTRDDRLRQPVFLGLREDKKASEVIAGEGNLETWLTKSFRIVFTFQWSPFASQQLRKIFRSRHGFNFDRYYDLRIIIPGSVYPSTNRPGLHAICREGNKNSVCGSFSREKRLSPRRAPRLSLLPHSPRRTWVRLKPLL